MANLEKMMSLGELINNVCTEEQMTYATKKLEKMSQDYRDRMMKEVEHGDDDMHHDMDHHRLLAGHEGHEGYDEHGDYVHHYGFNHEDSDDHEKIKD